MTWEKSSGGMSNALISPAWTALDTRLRRAWSYCPSRTWILARGIDGSLTGGGLATIVVFEDRVVEHEGLVPGRSLSVHSPAPREASCTSTRPGPPGSV